MLVQAVALGALGACTPRGRSGPPANPSPAVTRPCARGDLSFTVSARPADPALGQPVTVTARLVVTGSAPCLLQLDKGAEVGLDVPGGSAVWRREVTWTVAAGSTQTVHPGQAFTAAAPWDGSVSSQASSGGQRTAIRAAPGSYLLEASGGLVVGQAAPVTFTVLPVGGPPPAALCPQYCYLAVLGDFDGRSPDEVFAVYSTEPASPGEPRTTIWRARLTLAAGPLDIDLSPYLGGGAPAPAVRAVADTNGDGRDEIFLETDSGASTEQVAIFGLTDAAAGSMLTPARVIGRTSGEPLATFPLGGTAGHQDGIECAIGPNGVHQLQVVGWQTIPGSGSVSLAQTTYRWSGLTLTWFSSASGTDQGDPLSLPDPYLERANAGLQC